MDGWFYLVYAGQGQERAEEFRGTACRYPKGRGWNRLGFARSRDLIEWELPGHGGQVYTGDSRGGIA